MAKKAPSGAGSIRQRVDGRWEGRYSIGFNPGTGRQIQKSVYGKTQKEVRQKLNKIVSEIDDGTYVQPTKITVREWLSIWVEEYLGNVKPYTRKAYEDRIRLHIVPAIGAVKLTELTPPMVQKFINNLGKDSTQRVALSPKTIKNIHGVLHRSLHQAVIIGYIRTNPGDNCTLPRVIRPEITPMDDQTIAQFLQACKNERYRELFLITLFTGLRQGEVLGLEWNCIDWEHGTMTVKRQLQREKKPQGKFYLSTLKNGKTRTICLAPFVLNLFKERLEQQARERLNAYDLWHEDFPGLVFETETGGHVSHTTVRKHFKRIVKSMGIPEQRFHDLRHSFAVLSLQNGDDIKTVQENLGHHSAAFTLDVYSHVTDRMRQNSAHRMQEYISNIKDEAE